MANDLHTAPEVGERMAGTASNGARGEPGLATMAKGILDDALELLKQQFLMLKAEIRAEIRQLITSRIPLACGLAPLLFGGLMLCFFLVHLIHWATLPAGSNADPAAIPLWGAYLIVAAFCLLLGGLLEAIGYYRLKNVHPLPEQTVHALEENIQWLMNHPRK
jgi:hypothetical protein